MKAAVILLKNLVLLLSVVIINNWHISSGSPCYRLDFACPIIGVTRPRPWYILPFQEGLVFIFKNRLYLSNFSCLQIAASGWAFCAMFHHMKKKKKNSFMLCCFFNMKRFACVCFYSLQPFKIGRGRLLGLLKDLSAAGIEPDLSGSQKGWTIVSRASKSFPRAGIASWMAGVRHVSCLEICKAIIRSLGTEDVSWNNIWQKCTTLINNLLLGKLLSRLTTQEFIVYEYFKKCS